MSDLTVTNEVIWIATQPVEGEPLSAFQSAVKQPMHVLGARNASTLARVVDGALADINTARIALCEAHGTKKPDSGSYDITNLPDFTAGWNTLMAESRTFANVRALRVLDFAATASLTPENAGRLGALLTDE